MGIQIYIKQTDRYGVKELLNDLGFTKAGREIKAMQEELGKSKHELSDIINQLSNLPPTAKAGIIGEINFTVQDGCVCPQCWAGGWSEDCDMCHGESDSETCLYDQEVQVPWNTCKEIWKRMNAYAVDYYKAQQIKKEKE